MPSPTVISASVPGAVIAPGGLTAGDEFNLDGSQAFSLSVWGTDAANVIDVVHFYEASDDTKQYVENTAVGSSMSSAISAGHAAIAKFDRTIGNATKWVKITLHSTAGVTGYRIVLRGI